MKKATLETALLAGATGLIGSEIAAQWPGPGPLHLLVRRAVQPRTQMQQVHVVDFAALPPLPKADAAFCSLGTTIKVAGSEAAFRAVDLDAVLAFARAAKRAGVKRFAVVSALGASRTSSVFYNRVKGEMEAELTRMGFERLVIARPSLLAGNRAATGQPTRLGERITLALTAPLGPLIPKTWRPIPAATVARALRLALMQDGPAVQIIESAELQDLGRP
jgi:uncharacterized protein YbjT (DUF2867 family)